jgi:putative acetyltransferase
MIRLYRDDDLDRLIEVWYQASLLAHPFLSERFLNRERELIAGVYLPVAETYVYEKDGVLVGFIALMGDEVGAIFVDPALHGRGIGRALMDYARDLRTRLELDVFKENHIGRRFYARYGFKLVEEHKHGPSSQWLMRLALEDG